MKKAFIVSAMLCCFIDMASVASPIDPEVEGESIQVVLECNTIDDSVIHQGNHRTTPQIPNIYFDASGSTVYFENPCYECTLELVVPGTDTAVFSYAIPDGEDSVQLPTFLSGEYELHIHRGNYCFWGMIELS